MKNTYEYQERGTERAFAEHYGRSIGKEISSHTLYWCDTVMTKLIGIDEHSGVYRSLNKEYPNNIQKMCDEYELEIVNGRPVPRANSKYQHGVPANMIFDYSISTRG